MQRLKIFPSKNPKYLFSVNNYLVIGRKREFFAQFKEDEKFNL